MMTQHSQLFSVRPSLGRPGEVWLEIHARDDQFGHELTADEAIELAGYLLLAVEHLKEDGLIA